MTHTNSGTPRARTRRRWPIPRWLRPLAAATAAAMAAALLADQHYAD